MILPIYVPNFSIIVFEEELLDTFIKRACIVIFVLTHVNVVDLDDLNCVQSTLLKVHILSDVIVLELGPNGFILDHAVVEFQSLDFSPSEHGIFEGKLVFSEHIYFYF